ncbi:hypothetical protein PVAP13_2NG380603 [Panicum virgatum]|uniref:DUF8039 domain-containing protein n=1 Tax=Panicum virgatum TaxID=38727 RepID=A0A8T0VG45_PANVG|nr:hypothetical protein PVAP13_2NG380603 [Panicum virgatum]
MDARVNKAIAQALSQRGTAGSHPDVVICPASQRRSSCASTAAPNIQAEHQLQIEPTAVDDQRYPVDDVTRPTPCELHVRAKNISIHVAYGSALPLNPCTTIHGRPIPPGYTSVTIEQIVGNNEDLELGFIGGDGEKTLGDAMHEIVLWRKADIKLTASTTAPVLTDRPSRRPPSSPSPQPPPSPLSPPAQRATSTPTPPAPEKGKKKTASLPAAGPSKKKQKTVERKLTYEKTAEEEKVPLELGKQLLASLDNPPQPKSLPSDYERTLTKAHKVRNVKKKCGKTVPQLGTQQKELEPLRVPGLQILHPTDIQLQADLQAAIFFFLKLD